MSSHETRPGEPIDMEIRELENRIKALEIEKEDLRKQLLQINKDRVEYLQNVSHQLVAPLNAIKWHIENLTAGRISNIERIQKVLRSIYSQSTIAVHLAKNFALMSNLEADHRLSALREPLERVDLRQLIVNLADDFQPLAWGTDINIKVIDKPLDSAPNVLVIKPLISQVFSNIIENAVKYSSHGATILIDGSQDSVTRTVSVRIRNRGIPLTAEDKKRIFGRGYRGQEAKNLYPAGTGFGLYIAKKIVEIHEGIIEGSSDSSGETIFMVTLHVDKLAGKTKQRDEKDNINRR